MMTPTAVGIAIGAILAFTALIFGFWGFLLMTLFLAVGALLGRVAEGKLDLGSVRDALTGRRSSS
ncbi:putative membrane protein [Arthrobacter sp. CAN_A212]|nr:putative membrane protein [Arthrobacter sp. CAN_C5]